jgi:Acetyltransferase (GNAT) domain
VTRGATVAGDNLMAECAAYAHPAYAASLAEFGTPRALPRSGGWILQRDVPASSQRDGMGCYPLFACRDWSQLPADLDEIGRNLVSLSLVTDPFGEYDVGYLKRCFDVVIPFKEHFVRDLRRADVTSVHPHHNRNARRALRQVSVERCEEPSRFLDDWVTLYANLIQRYDIRGIAAFSASSFARQLQVPGLVMFRAVHKESTVGIMLWYEKKNVSYYHLAAYSDLGYKLNASFALIWSALEYFAADGVVEWLNFGAGAGVRKSDGDGLSRFKRGWSTGTRTAYFCGRIFDQESYMALVRARTNADGTAPDDYFPAYREGEFV